MFYAMTKMISFDYTTNLEEFDHFYGNLFSYDVDVKKMYIEIGKETRLRRCLGKRRKAPMWEETCLSKAPTPPMHRCIGFLPEMHRW